MNICMVGYDLNPPWVEATRNLAYELSKQLVRQGHSVHIITESNPKLSREEVISGVHFHRIPKKFFALYATRKIRELKNRYGLDIIHAQNLTIYKSYISMATICRRLVDIPVVGYICQLPLTFDKWLHIIRHDAKEAFMKLDMLTLNALIKLEFNLTDKAVVTSLFLKKTFKEIVDNEIEVIPPFINVQNFSSESVDVKAFRRTLGIENGAPLLLYVGTHKVFRNEEHFLKAFSILLRDFPQAKAILISTLPATKRISRLIKKLGIEKYLIFFSRDKMINIMNLISASDVYVFTGFSSVGSIDPPLTVIEAITLGTPVVAYNTGGIHEVVNDGKNGFLVTPYNYRGLVEAIARTLNGSLNCRCMDTNKRLVESMFDSRLAAQRFISIYEKIV